MNCYSCPGAVGACPIGSLQAFYSGSIFRFPFLVLAWLLLCGLVLGRFLCGWFCPFGLIQDVLFRIPVAKIGKSRVTLVLSRLKYLWGFLFVLIVPLVLFFWSGVGEPVFCKYICPVGTLEAGAPLLVLRPELRGLAGWLAVWKFTILGMFLVAMIVIYRPFCRFLCPLGAWCGLFNKFAFFGIAVHETRCTKCGRCAAVCSMDVRIAGDRECISCGTCRDICPEQAIYFRHGSLAMHHNEQKEG
jgi:polyferredoxin